jgi:hypothetical protein
MMRGLNREGAKDAKERGEDEKEISVPLFVSFAIQMSSSFL